MSCAPQYRLNQMGSSSLPVGSGDANHGKLTRGMTIESTRGGSEALPSIRHLHHRPALQRRLRQIASLDQDSDGACYPRGLNEVVAVPPEPADAHEQIAGPDLSGVVPDPMDLDIGRPPKDPVFGPVNQVEKSHDGSLPLIATDPARPEF